MEYCITWILVVGTVWVRIAGAYCVPGGGPNLTCYSCFSQSGDNRCLENPDQDDLPGGGYLNCNNGWCTLRRQEYTDNPGQIVTFIRGCETVKPTYLDDIIEDGNQRFYFRSCCTEFCNVGDGLLSIPDRKCHDGSDSN